MNEEPAPTMIGTSSHLYNSRIRNYPESYRRILVVSTLIATANISVCREFANTSNWPTLNAVRGVQPNY